MESMTSAGGADNPRSIGEGDGSEASRRGGSLPGWIAPEALLPSQLPRAGDEMATRAGVKGLMLAILEDAVYCLGEIYHPCATRRMEARKAEAWIREAGDWWLFSFDSICRILDLAPEDLRYRLLSVRPETVVASRGRRRRSHRVERGKRKRRSGAPAGAAAEPGGPAGPRGRLA